MGSARYFIPTARLQNYGHNYIDNFEVFKLNKGHADGEQKKSKEEYTNRMRINNICLSDFQYGYLLQNVFLFITSQYAIIVKSRLHSMDITVDIVDLYIY